VSPLEIELVPILSDNYVYLLHEPGDGRTGVVDPGEAEPVLARLDERGLSLDWILATHHHPDHTGGIEAVKKATGCRVVGPPGSVPAVDVTVGGGDTFELGQATATIFATPGHTLDHITFWFEKDRALFCADTLFALGCGRLFEGTAAQMWASLSTLRALPDDARVYCGHEYTLANARFAVTVDPDNEDLAQRLRRIEKLREKGEPTIPSQLGVEKRTNPFLRPDDPAIRKHLGLESASDVDVFAEIRRRKDEA
jgi:hydroxyacylglutathione hydrolase